MGEASITDAEPPENDSILMAETMTDTQPTVKTLLQNTWQMAISMNIWTKIGYSSSFLGISAAFYDPVPESRQPVHVVFIGVSIGRKGVVGELLGSPDPPTRIWAGGVKGVCIFDTVSNALVIFNNPVLLIVAFV